MIVGILNRNEKGIVQQAQAYLDAYEKGKKCEMASKIDEIISILDNITYKSPIAINK